MWRTHVGTAFGLAVLLTVTMLYAMAPHIVDWAFDTYDAPWPQLISLRSDRVSARGVGPVLDLEAGMRLVILAVAVVAVAALAMLGEEPDACRYAENWRQPGVCDR